MTETVYLDVDDLLTAAERLLGHPAEVRDWGLLDSALARPRASVFGEDAYSTVHTKSAALLHSLTRNYALVDGNKRLGINAALLFYGLNGWRVTASDDDLYDLVLDVAEGRLDRVEAIAETLAVWAVRR